MDKNDYITSSEKRKKGKHLTAEDRGAIQALKEEGRLWYSCHCQKYWLRSWDRYQ